jgi:hypothetical protein
MFGQDAGHAGERSFRDFIRLSLTKENRWQPVDPACRLLADFVKAERSHVRQKSCLRGMGGSDVDFKSNSGAMYRGVFAVLTLVRTMPR